jgi:adenylosuccinate lyase
MIKRYSPKQMERIWSDEHRFELWHQIETFVCEAWAELGRMPAHVADSVRNAKYSIQRIEEIEKEVGHDVIAFVTALAENAGEAGRYIHFGLTSSDVIDTAFAVQIVESLKLLLSDLEALIQSLDNLIKDHKYTVMVGRTHGAHAEPTTFGLKLLTIRQALLRSKVRIEHALKESSVGKISGAVGTHATVDPRVEEYVCQKLGLRPAEASSQIIQRDIHAHVISELALLASVLEMLATEIRLLQRTEVSEVFEPFSDRQKGSSAMPHKRNPILCERICGLARTVRGYSLTAMENVALWHERDISHSSAERIIFPDAFMACDYMVQLAKKILDGLEVRKDKMLQNLNIGGGVIFSQRVLLALIEVGMDRDRAYRIVQSAAFSAINDGTSFFDTLRANKDVIGLLGEDRLKELFDVNFYLANLDVSFDRSGV